MPKIPSYTRQNTIPGKAASVYDNSPDYIGQALTGKGGVSEDLSHAANVLLRRQEELKKQDDEITKIKLTNQYDSDTTDQLIKWKQEYTGENASNLQNVAMDWHKNEKETYLKNIKDPVLAAKIGNHFDDKFNATRLDLATHQVKQREIVLDSTVYNSIDTISKGVVLGVKPLEQGLTEFNNTMDSLLASGYITPEKYKQKLIDGTSKIVESHLDKTAIDDPTLALKLINDGYYSKYLTVEKLNYFNQKAHILQKEKELEDKTKLIEQGKQEVETYKSELLDKWNAGTLSKNDLNWKPVNFSEYPSAVQNDWNTANEHWMTKLDADKKEKARLVKEGLKPENNDEYNKFAIRAMTDAGDTNIKAQDKLTHRDIDAKVRSGEFKFDWGKKLHAMLDTSTKTANPIYQTYVTLATNELKKAEVNGLFGEKGSVEAAVEMGKTIAAMHQWVTDNPGKNPLDFTKELLAPAVKKYIFGSTTPSEKDVKARLEKMLAPKTETPITNKPSVGGGSYKDNPVLFPENNSAPKIGEIVKGYRFKGGDPAKKESWVKVK